MFLVFGTSNLLEFRFAKPELKKGSLKDHRGFGSTGISLLRPSSEASCELLNGLLPSTRVEPSSLKEPKFYC